MKFEQNSGDVISYILCARFVSEIISQTKENKIINIIADNVLPLYSQIALFDKQNKDISRGQNYFGFDKSQEVKSLSDNFFRLILESILAWSKDVQLNNQKYVDTFNNLVQQGVSFPNQFQFMVSESSKRLATIPNTNIEQQPQTNYIQDQLQQQLQQYQTVEQQIKEYSHNRQELKNIIQLDNEEIALKYNDYQQYLQKVMEFQQHKIQIPDNNELYNINQKCIKESTDIYEIYNAFQNQQIDQNQTIQNIRLILELPEPYQLQQDNLQNQPSQQSGIQNQNNQENQNIQEVPQNSQLRSSQQQLNNQQTNESQSISSITRSKIPNKFKQGTKFSKNKDYKNFSLSQVNTNRSQNGQQNNNNNNQFNSINKSAYQSVSVYNNNDKRFQSYVNTSHKVSNSQQNILQQQNSNGKQGINDILNDNTSSVVALKGKQVSKNLSLDNSRSQVANNISVSQNQSSVNRKDIVEGLQEKNNQLTSKLIFQQKIIQQLQGKINNLEQQNKDQQEHNNELVVQQEQNLYSSKHSQTSQNAQYIQKIQNLQNENKEIHGDLVKLENKLLDQNQVIQEKEKEIQDLNLQQDQLKVENQYLQGMVQELETKLQKQSSSPSQNPLNSQPYLTDKEQQQIPPITNYEDNQQMNNDQSHNQTINEILNMQQQQPNQQQQQEKLSALPPDQQQQRLSNRQEEEEVVDIDDKRNANKFQNQPHDNYQQGQEAAYHRQSYKAQQNFQSQSPDRQQGFGDVDIQVSDRHANVVYQENIQKFPVNNVDQIQEQQPQYQQQEQQQDQNLNLNDYNSKQKQFNRFQSPYRKSHPHKIFDLNEQQQSNQALDEIQRALNQDRIKEQQAQNQQHQQQQQNKVLIHSPESNRNKVLSSNHNQNQEPASPQLRNSHQNKQGNKSPRIFQNPFSINNNNYDQQQNVQQQDPHHMKYSSSHQQQQDNVQYNNQQSNQQSNIPSQQHSQQQIFSASNTLRSSGHKGKFDSIPKPKASQLPEPQQSIENSHQKREDSYNQNKAQDIEFFQGSFTTLNNVNNTNMNENDESLLQENRIFRNIQSHISQIDRFKAGCLRDKYPIYDDNGLQIGCTSKLDMGKEDKYVRFSIYFTNKSQQTFSNISIQIQDDEKNLKRQDIIVTQTAIQEIEPRQQKKLEIIVHNRQLPFKPILLQVQYMGVRPFFLGLPMTVNKYFEWDQNSQYSPEQWEAQFDSCEVKEQTLGQKRNRKICHSFTELNKNFPYIFPLQSHNNFELYGGKFDFQFTSDRVYTFWVKLMLENSSNGIGLQLAFRDQKNAVSIADYILNTFKYILTE